MMKRRLVNGSDTVGIALDDRGLQYGDGLFETMAATNGRVRHLGSTGSLYPDTGVGGGTGFGLPAFAFSHARTFTRAASNSRS